MRLRCWLGFHRWRVVAAEDMRLVDRGFTLYSPDDEGEPITRILRRCDMCDDVSSKRLHGHWASSLPAQPQAPGVG